MFHQLDEKNIRILQLLQENARMTTVDIAKVIGISVTRTYERIKRLEHEKYITNYVALLNARMLGKGMIVFSQVQLQAHGTAEVRLFEKEMVKLDEVMVYHTTGECDYLVKICVKDMDEYGEFIHKKMSKLPNVGTIQSFVVLREAKKTLAYDIKIEA